MFDVRLDEGSLNKDKPVRPYQHDLQRRVGQLYLAAASTHKKTRNMGLRDFVCLGKVAVRSLCLGDPYQF